MTSLGFGSQDCPKSPDLEDVTVGIEADFLKVPKESVLEAFHGFQRHSQVRLGCLSIRAMSIHSSRSFRMVRVLMSLANVFLLTYSTQTLVVSWECYSTNTVSLGGYWDL